MLLNIEIRPAVFPEPSPALKFLKDFIKASTSWFREREYASSHNNPLQPIDEEGMLPDLEADVHLPTLPPSIPHPGDDRDAGDSKDPSDDKNVFLKAVREVFSDDRIIEVIDEEIQQSLDAL